MAYIQDSTESFMINLEGEGFGTIDGIEVINLTTAIDYIWEEGVWDTGMPIAFPGDSISVHARATNNGVLTDTIYVEFVSTEVTPTEPTIQTTVLPPGGGTSIGTWTFTMPSTDINITINAGHEE